jgi:prepilin-type N-terminal cleavage/methylation domain-containing protein
MKIKNKGFTLVEIVIVIAIMAIISTVVIFSFSNINSSSALDKGAMEVLSNLNKARSLTLSSKDSSSYGVRFESSRIILFKSPYNSASSENIVTDLNSLVTISSVSLSGGVPEATFSRLSGAVTANGNVTLSLVSDPALVKTINIYETGLSEIN